MKLRKRPAQPLNLSSAVQVAAASGSGQPLASPLPTRPEVQGPTPPMAVLASQTPAAWPTELSDRDWSRGWADQEAIANEGQLSFPAASPAPADAPPVIETPLEAPTATFLPEAPTPAKAPVDPVSASSADELGAGQTGAVDSSAVESSAVQTGGAESNAVRTGGAGPGGGWAEDLDPPPLRQALSSRTAASADGPKHGRSRPEPNRSKGQAAKAQLDRRAATSLGLSYRPPKPELGAARYAYLAAGLGAVLWSGSFIAFMLAFQKGVAPLTYVPFQSTLLAVLTVLPAAFMILAAFAIRQGAWMAAEARTARRLAQDMVLPAAQAASETASVLEAVRREIDRATGATRAALDEISVLRDALTQETDRLTEAAGDAQRTARIVGETLASERDEIAQLSRELRGHAEDVAAAVSQQTQLVADASDLARSQLQEAEATLVARAADLTAATALAGASAQDAGDRLAEHTQVFEAAGAALAERLRVLETRLGEQREGLGALIEQCQEDQDEIAARLESRRAQLIDTVADARRGASELAQSSDESAEALRELIAAAARQMQELVQTTAAERAAMSQDAAETYAAIADHARYAQDAATAHVETARIQVEQLGQLAFDAGQRANQAFDGRISEARRLIEQSAALVEDAGMRSAARIEVGVAASRSALEGLGQALAEVDARISKLPEEARSQADAVRVAVERAAADLASAVRKLSLETKAVDDSFQARVRKSYDALRTQAALGGGTKGAEPTTSASAPSSKPFPQAPRSDPADLEALRRALAAEEAELEEDLAASARGGGGSEVKTSTPTDLGLRRRLRLTPTEADTALKSVFDPLQGRGRGAGTPRMFAERAEAAAERPARRAVEPDLDEWTWKDLLSSIDEAPATDDALAGLMIEEINALGVDAGALLPRLRLDEISAVAVSMGPTAVRDTVRRLAPAAVRRLSRRVLTDRALKDQADRYLRRYLDLLQGSIQKDPTVVNALLGSDPGRAYLLLDAAVGDLH